MKKNSVDRVLRVRSYWSTFRCLCHVHDFSFTSCRQFTLVLIICR